MKNTLLIFITAVLLFSFTKANKDETIKKGEEFTVEINDSTKITIIQALNKENNLPVYYYSELNIPACNTGECKLIEMTMYWDIFGNYYKYSVPSNTPLTKVGHKKFKKKEYLLLHQILNDQNSKLKDIKFSDLSEKQAGEKFKTDARSGASIKLFREKSSIKGAVKTCHTLWHVANGETKNKIAQQTKSFFNNKSNRIPDYGKNKANETIKKINEYNLTQVQFFIKNLNKEEFDKKDFSKSLNKLGYSLSINKAILFSNYASKTKLKITKQQKRIKSNLFYNSKK